MTYSKSIGDVNTYPPKKTWQDIFNELESKVDYLTSQQILSGFDYILFGVNCHFKYDLYHQVNFANNTNNANMTLAMYGMRDNPLLTDMLGKSQDGTITASDLPSVKPSEWKCSCSCYGPDGVKRTFELNMVQYLALSRAADNHRTNTMNNNYSKYIIPLKNTKTIQELKAVAKELDIAKTYSRVKSNSTIKE